MAASHHVVAAGHEATAGAAEEVLRAGGNAFDAAVAAMAAACAAEPVLTSLGGGGFLMACPAAGAPRLYDFFVHTPRRPGGLEDLDFYPIEADFGPVRQEFHIGRGTIAVPGVVAGMFRVHAELGRLPMRELMAPAVALAKEGVRTTEFQAYLFSVVRPTFEATEACRAIFASRRVDGELVTAGEVLRQPALADTLEVMAREGEALFYRGEIAARIAEDLADGGQIGREDLEGYRVERREPLALDVAGARILTNPPPSSGGVLAAFGLHLLDDPRVSALDPDDVAHARAVAAALHATVQARVDAHAREAPLTEGALLDRELIARYRAEVLDRPRAHRGTTHVSVVDAEGNLASVTVSNGEGSGYVVPGAGIVLNNMLGEEDLNPGGFQRWAPGVRMTSMMMPSAVAWRDGTRVACGSGGSNRIRTALMQVLLRLVLHGQAPEPAVLAPRLHVEGDLLSVEGGFDRERIAPLLEEWPEHHLWEERNVFFGGAHTVRLGPGVADGCGDPRRAGVFRRVPG
jgi:gamma-glutamyltranspeptidase/glutathione hydrolase